MRVRQRKSVRYARKLVDKDFARPAITQELGFGNLIRRTARMSILSYFAPLMVLGPLVSRRPREVGRLHSWGKKDSSDIRKDVVQDNRDRKRSPAQLRDR